MKCSFCGKKMVPGSGKLYVKRDGTAFFFCSKKCEKNLLKLNRKPHSTPWTELYQKRKKAGKKGGE